MYVNHSRKKTSRVSVLSGGDSSISYIKYKIKIKNNSNYSLSISLDNNKIEAKKTTFFMSPDSLKEIEITINR